MIQSNIGKSSKSWVYGGKNTKEFQYKNKMLKSTPKKKVLIKLLPASFISRIRLSKFESCISHCW